VDAAARVGVPIAYNYQPKIATSERLRGPEKYFHFAENRYVVRLENFCPGFSTVDGNFG